MAGHNKWSQIKNKKAGVDSKRGAAFTKFARTIAVESKKAKGDVNAPGLRAAIERARKIDMPKDNIERAIEKGKGGVGVDMETVVYEMFGPGGCAMLIETLTDNKNRTFPEVKHIVVDLGYALGAPGSAQWAFTRAQDGTYSPTTTVPLEDADAEKLGVLVEALEAHDDVQEIFTNVSEE